MYKVKHTINPNLVVSISSEDDTRNHPLSIAVLEYTGMLSACRDNPNLATLRCDKHIFKIPYSPDVSMLGRTLFTTT